MRWTDEETRALIQIITDLDVMESLYRPRQRNVNIYTQVLNALTEIGIQRSTLQVRDKFKKLKYSYLQERNQVWQSGEHSGSQFCFWEEMHVLMGQRPVAVAGDNVLDTSPSAQSEGNELRIDIDVRFMIQNWN
ncbi:UNVERIFIED_CONTAM: hypothetical protein FKN15_062238 [Acipenser sinensis]